MTSDSAEESSAQPSWCIVQTRRTSLPNRDQPIPRECGPNHLPRGKSMPHITRPTNYVPPPTPVGPVPPRMPKFGGSYYRSQNQSVARPLQRQYQTPLQTQSPPRTHLAQPPSPSDRFIRRSRKAASLPPRTQHAPTAVVDYFSTRAAEMRALAEGRKRHFERQHRVRQRAYIQAQAEAEAEARLRTIAAMAMMSRSSVVHKFQQQTSEPHSPGGSSTASASTERLIRRRIRIEPEQLTYLEKLWKETRFPSTSECQISGSQIGLTSRQIQVWFQNRRQKDKRLTDPTYGKNPQKRYKHPDSPSSPSFAPQYTHRDMQHFDFAALHKSQTLTLKPRHAEADVAEQLIRLRRPLSPSPEPGSEIRAVDTPTLAALVPRRLPQPVSDTNARSATSSASQHEAYPQSPWSNLRSQLAPLPPLEDLLRTTRPRTFGQESTPSADGWKWWQKL